MEEEEEKEEEEFKKRYTLKVIQEIDKKYAQCRV